jgi:hypothetical protein
MRAYLAVVEEILDARGNGRIMRFLPLDRDARRAGRTPAGFSPT